MAPRPYHLPLSRRICAVTFSSLQPQLYALRTHKSNMLLTHARIQDKKPAMDQQEPPEFILDVFADPRSVRDVVKGKGALPHDSQPTSYPTLAPRNRRIQPLAIEPPSPWNDIETDAFGTEQGFFIRSSSIASSPPSSLEPAKFSTSPSPTSTTMSWRL